jgi:hypothetical protein
VKTVAELELKHVYRGRMYAKIDLYVAGRYVCSTNRAKTIAQARWHYARANPSLVLSQIKGARA